MNLSAVMDEIGTNLSEITGLRVFDYPPPTISPPAGYVSYPETVKYHQTYRGGMTRVTDFPVVIAVGKATDRAARDQVTEYVAETGAKSVKLALESATWTNLNTCVVTQCEFDVLTIAAVDYICAIFSLDITAPGSTA